MSLFSFSTKKDLRYWIRSSFKRSKDFLHREAADPAIPEFSKGRVLFGSICLDGIGYAIKCFGADRQDLGEAILNRFGKITARAIATRGADVDQDAIGLQRIGLSLANRLGSALSPEAYSQEWGIPFEAFPTYIESDGTLTDEQNVARILWALLAVFEGNREQFKACCKSRGPIHRDLRAEMGLIPGLEALTSDQHQPGWLEYESALSRWLNPRTKTESGASSFRAELAAALVLVWCKGRLKSVGREEILKTFFGETLSAPLVVEEL